MYDACAFIYWYYDSFIGFIGLLTFVSLLLSASETLANDTEEKGKQRVNSVKCSYLGFAFWFFQQLESRKASHFCVINKT